jgi:hypothetical protein
LDGIYQRLSQDAGDVAPPYAVYEHILGLISMANGNDTQRPMGQSINQSDHGRTDIWYDYEPNRCKYKLQESSDKY